jgi:hypothetical protein
LSFDCQAFNFGLLQSLVDSLVRDVHAFNFETLPGQVERVAPGPHGDIQSLPSGQQRHVINQET